MTTTPDVEERRFTSQKRAGEIELRAKADGTRVLSAIGIVFESYSENLGGYVEEVDPRAVARVLTDERTLGLHNHDPNQALGRNMNTMTLVAEDIGVRYSIDLAARGDSPIVDHVASSVSRKDLQGSSFSFRLAPDGDEWGVTEQGFPLRRLTAIARLYDVGPVGYPAYPGTRDSGNAASVAKRSLARHLDRPLEDIDELITRGELGKVLDPKHRSTHPLSAGPSETPGSRLALARAELDLRARRFA